MDTFYWNKILSCLPLYSRAASQPQISFSNYYDNATAATVVLWQQWPVLVGWDPEIDTFLFSLASATFYRVAARAFDMVNNIPGSAQGECKRCCSHPTAEELPHFTRLAGSAAFNWVVGAIVGCHIWVKVPAEDATCYPNRKLFLSAQLQAIWDDTARIPDIFDESVGSVHDAWILQNSPIYYEKFYPPPASTAD